MSMPLVILPKTEKSQQVFNEHELSIRVEVQKNFQLIGQCHRCQKYGHDQSYCTVSPKCLKCVQDHMTQLYPQTGQGTGECANYGGDHPENSPTCSLAPRRNLQVQPRLHSWLLLRAHLRLLKAWAWEQHSSPCSR
nr:unnamed protein product [Callosobruchus chinensis]